MKLAFFLLTALLYLRSAYATPANLNHDLTFEAVNRVAFLAGEFFTKNGVDTTKECKELPDILEKYYQSGVDPMTLTLAWVTTRNNLRSFEAWKYLESIEKPNWEDLRSRKIVELFGEERLRKYFSLKSVRKEVSRYLASEQQIGIYEAHNEPVPKNLFETRRVTASSIDTALSKNSYAIRYDEVINSGTQLRLSAKRQALQALSEKNSWTRRVSQAGVSTVESLTDFIGGAGVYAFWAVADSSARGRNEAAQFFEGVGRQINKLGYHSLLDTNFTELNKKQMFWHSLPIVHGGAAIGEVLEGVNVAYEHYYLKKMLGFSDEYINKSDGILIGKTGFYAAQMAVGALGMGYARAASLARNSSLAASSIELKAAQALMTKRSLQWAGGLSAVSAGGQEFYIAGMKDGSFDAARFSSNTLHGTGASLIFMNAVTRGAMAVSRVPIKSLTPARLAGTVDLIEASGDAPGVQLMAKNADNWLQYIGVGIIATASLADVADVSIVNGWGKVLHKQSSALTLPDVTTAELRNLMGEAKDALEAEDETQSFVKQWIEKFNYLKIGQNAYRWYLTKKRQGMGDHVGNVVLMLLMSHSIETVGGFSLAVFGSAQAESLVVKSLATATGTIVTIPGLDPLCIALVASYMRWPKQLNAALQIPRQIIANSSRFLIENSGAKQTFYTFFERQQALNRFAESLAKAPDNTYFVTEKDEEIELQLLNSEGHSQIKIHFAFSKESLEVTSTEFNLDLLKSTSPDAIRQQLKPLGWNVQTALIESLRGVTQNRLEHESINRFIEGLENVDENTVRIQFAPAALQIESKFQLRKN